MNATNKTVVCEGCGHEHRLKDQGDPYDHATYTTVIIAPDVEVTVCGGGKTFNGARTDCTIKVLKKRSLCPGCGDKIEWPARSICSECLKKLDLAERIQKEESTARRNVEISKYRVLGPGSTQDEERAIGPILDLLGDVSGSEKVGRSDNTVWVEVTEKQAEAFNDFASKLKALYKAARAAGYAEGRNLLLGLASGKLTTDELDRHEIEKARRARDE